MPAIYALLYMPAGIVNVLRALVPHFGVGRPTGVDFITNSYHIDLVIFGKSAKVKLSCHEWIKVVQTGTF